MTSKHAARSHAAVDSRLILTLRIGQPETNRQTAAYALCFFAALGGAQLEHSGNRFLWFARCQNTERVFSDAPCGQPLQRVRDAETEGLVWTIEQLHSRARHECNRDIKTDIGSEKVSGAGICAARFESGAFSLWKP